MAAVLIAVVFSSVVPARSSDDLELLHYWTGSLHGGLQAMVDQANAQSSDPMIRAVGLEHESFKAIIKSRLAGGAAPDIFSYWAGARVQALVDDAKLEPLDDLWDTAGLDQVFSPAVAASCLYSGHRYAVPVTQHFVALFYDKRLFDSLGLVPPRSWDEFTSLCATIKARGISPIALGTRDRWPAQFWFDYILLRTAGPQYRQELMSGRRSYTDPQVRLAFELWKVLLDREFVSPRPQTMDWAEAAREIHDGRAAMTLMGTWLIGHFEAQFGWRGGREYDFFPFPDIDPGIPDTALGPIDVLVLSRKADTAKAKEALLRLAAPGPLAALSRGSGALAPDRNVPLQAQDAFKRRILEAAGRSAFWAFNYDLATPPSVADVGLGCFDAFLKRPALLDSILRNTQMRAESCFGQQQAKAP